jgi:hypothetical protein
VFQRLFLLPSSAPDDWILTPFSYGSFPENTSLHSAALKALNLKNGYYIKSNGKVVPVLN